MKRGYLKTTVWIGLAVAAIVLVPPATASGDTNFVPNPGFEQGGCGGNTPVIFLGTGAGRLRAAREQHSHAGEHTGLPRPARDPAIGPTRAVRVWPVWRFQAPDAGLVS
jgi:hypothetical protein